MLGFYGDRPCPEAIVLPYDQKKLGPGCFVIPALRKLVEQIWIFDL
ncbi:MAG: hypothetical protein VKJ64_17390 [Leptolyngbyaceae bacterium]|nr:hypothetical protein [Leptolyngbyaceae bacterium]